MSETTETTGLVNENITTDSGNLDNDNLDNVGQDGQDADNNADLDNDNLDNVGQDGEEKQPDIQTNDLYGAPETYNFKDLKYPDGIVMDEALAKEFAPIGKELNLSQQGANKLAEFLIEYQQKQLVNAPEKIAEFKKQEAAQTKLAYEQMLNKDKEIGGGDTSKMNAYIDVADVGYNSFASDELKNLLHSLSLDFHPAVIKHFYRLGKLCGNDKLTKTSSPVSEKQTPAQILFGSKNTDD